MINFLRLGDKGSGVARLRVVSIAANVMAFALELLRFGLFAVHTANTWGSQYILSELRANLSWWIPYFVIAISTLVETVYSIRQAGAAERRSYA